MTSSPLIWEEKARISEAQQNGFRYLVDLEGVRIVFTVGNVVNHDIDNYHCGCLTDIDEIKDMAQAHADAVSSAIADEVSEERKLADQAVRALKLSIPDGSQASVRMRESVLNSYHEARK